MTERRERWTRNFQRWERCDFTYLYPTPTDHRATPVEVEPIARCLCVALISRLRRRLPRHNTDKTDPSSRIQKVSPKSSPCHLDLQSTSDRVIRESLTLCTPPVPSCPKLISHSVEMNPDHHLHLIGIPCLEEFPELLRPKTSARCPD